MSSLTVSKVKRRTREPPFSDALLGKALSRICHTIPLSNNIKLPGQLVKAIIPVHPTVLGFFDPAFFHQALERTCKRPAGHDTFHRSVRKRDFAVVGAVVIRLQVDIREHLRMCELLPIRTSQDGLLYHHEGLAVALLACHSPKLRARIGECFEGGTTVHPCRWSWRTSVYFSSLVEKACRFVTGAFSKARQEFLVHHSAHPNCRGSELDPSGGSHGP